MPLMKKLRAGNLLPMILLLIPFLYLAFSNPFGEPAQTILEVSYLSLILGITVWEAIRNTDEVEVAAARFSASVGAYAGVVGTLALVVVMTRVSAVADFVAALAESPANTLPPAATGFGLGALAAILLMFLCGIMAYATWAWRSSRSAA